MGGEGGLPLTLLGLPLTWVCSKPLTLDFDLASSVSSDEGEARLTGDSRVMDDRGLDSRNRKLQLQPHDGKIDRAELDMDACPKCMNNRKTW